MIFTFRCVMADKTDASQVEKLKKFVAETSADENVAKYYLQSEDWNLDVAIAGFKQLKLAEERRIESRTSDGSNRNDRPGIDRKNDRLGPLRRGLSMANSELVASVREGMQNSEKSEGIEQSYSLDGLPNYSFVLPNITVVKDPELVEALKKDLIDKATHQSLTKAGVLNWWSDASVSTCRKLFPMSTVGDGNCLLHAVSLAMWGFHDRLLTLRRALYHSLANESAKGALKRRWMYQQWKLNMEAGGLCFTPDEWDDEWKCILRLASDKPRVQNKVTAITRKISKQYSIATTIHDDSLKRSDSEGSDSFESLEEFHVFALAQVLRRTIIVVSDTMLRDLEGQPLQPINFGGIYLPIECDPAKCYKYPLVLGYDAGHFAALVPAEGEDVGANKVSLSSSVPLNERNLELLPLHFITDPGAVWPLTLEDSKKKKLPEMSKQEKLSILSKYLHVVKVSSATKSQSIFPFANNAVEELPLDSSDVGSYLEKKGREGKQFVSKAFENITTLMTGYTNAGKTSPKLQRKASTKPLYAAKLDLINRPKYFDDMVSNYISSSESKLQEQKGSIKTPPKRMQCATPGCTYFGSPETNYLCSKCFRYQQEMSHVHKSMPILREERPPLLKLASRQLSNPEKAESPNISEDSLMSFPERTYSDPLRPATAPPSDILLRENPIGPSRGSSFDDILLPARRQLPATAPLPSLDQSSIQHAPSNINMPVIPELLPAHEPKVPCAPLNTSSIYKPVGSSRVSTLEQQRQNTQRQDTQRQDMQRQDTQRQDTQRQKHQQQQQQEVRNQQRVNSRSFFRRELAQFDPVLNGADTKTLVPFCKSNGCKIFGTPEYDGFCYSCFARQYQKSGYV